MDEVKFRVWDFVRKNWANDYVLLNYDGDVINSVGKTEAANDYSVERFTGMHDDGGLKIYEGDIVEETLMEINSGALKFAQKIIRRYAIEFEAPNFVFSKNLYKTGSCIWNFQRRLIGNIHQTPELLNDEKIGQEIPK